MMLRGGTRYLCVYRRSVGSVARCLSSVAPNSSVHCAFYTPRVAGAAAAPRPSPVAANYRLWSSGRTSQDSESEPLTRGEEPSSSAVKETEDVEKELHQPLVEQQPQTWRQRAKTFAIEYGRVGICTHIVLSLVSFSTIYVGVSSGVDVKGILDSVGLSTSVSDSTTNSAGSFLIAYTLYKVLAPVRWPLTFAVTPVVLRALRRRGYMLATTNSSRSPPPQ
ncbi:hypothetical protein PHMEG_00013089 [Phytophthora megakarya]|uniref:DUF1279 domain-containing protein n=1 Tax=Phytophthora megakarya TaxID=4795 RepID=A0A225W765_9STRA|nr:hypothetical protein PHMEG_00013089 [Phytophthora megakarya]